MTKLTTLIIALLVVLILGFYMVSFQVRYDEVAVLTTFKDATEPTRDDTGQITDPGDLYREPGLYFKAPWPIQEVTRYSKRLHVLEDQLQEQQTSDGRSVIVKTFVAWRIQDPYTFWKEVETVARAEEILLGQLSSVNGVIGEHRFRELVNPEAGAVALAEIEKTAANRIRQQIGPSGYGIEIEEVGIRRLLLPEKVTESVFERMKSDREARAEHLLAQGEAEAGRIRKEAASKRDRILAFAEGRAQEIEALGAKEAAEAYSKFRENEQFAIFLRQMQALEEMLGFNTTFVFRADELDLLRMFKNGPAIVTDPETGEPRVVPAEGDDTAGGR